MSSRYHVIATFFLLTVPVLGGMVTACSGDDDSLRSVPNQGDPMVSPTMSTLNVNSWVSDSGYVKYHIVTPRWDMYEDLADPFWKFPEGLHIETFQPGGKPNGEITSDSATYYHQRRLARLDGHVVAVNTARDTFLTSQIFWDQAKTCFYTDSFIHIVKSDRIIEGYGFTANEQMTEYAIHRPTAIIPASALRGDSRPEPAGPVDTKAIPASEPVEADIRIRRAPEPASVRNRERDERHGSGAMNSLTTGSSGATANPNLLKR